MSFVGTALQEFVSLRLRGVGGNEVKRQDGLRGWRAWRLGAPGTGIKTCSSEKDCRVMG